MVSQNETSPVGTIVKLRVSLGKVKGLEPIVTNSAVVGDITVRFINFEWEQQVTTAKLPPAVQQRLLESMVDLVTLKLGIAQGTVNIHVDAKGEYRGQVHGLSWMFAFYACVCGLPTQLAYTGSFIYREGFISAGVMMHNLQMVAAKIVAAARAKVDLAIIGEDTNDFGVWNALTAHIK